MSLKNIFFFEKQEEYFIHIQTESSTKELITTQDTARVSKINIKRQLKQTYTAHHNSILNSSITAHKTDFEAD